MRKWIRAIDDLLRGETTRLSRLRSGTFDVSIVGLALHVLVFGVFYGFCMSWLALMRPEPVVMQVFASMVKVPALFLLTLAVTFPSLYVFNALVGSRLAFLTILRLMMAAIALDLVVLASFGPIVASFSGWRFSCRRSIGSRSSKRRFRPLRLRLLPARQPRRSRTPGPQAASGSNRRGRSTRCRAASWLATSRRSSSAGSSSSVSSAPR